MKDLKLGLQLGYWGSGPPANAPASWSPRQSGSGSTRSGRQRPTARMP